MVQQQQQSFGGLFTIEQFAQRHPAWAGKNGDGAPLRALRFDAKNGNTNGFAAAFKTIGRRVYVDERAFYACIDALQQQPVRKSRRAR